MSDLRPVNVSSGLPTTVLPSEPLQQLEQLREALDLGDQDSRRAGVARLAASNPKFLDAWAQLGQLARDDVEAYAYYRVGYHRGLDALRANGWRGSGYVRWAAASNRGFLRSLRGLRDAATRIGEADEAARCSLFLQQLDPGGIPAQG
jgi:Protein of unknown function (DUF3151)